ncbi:hypothetical protein C8J56DRAFT_776345 [Mycena floridula]|nr:hypothetical protein C8J56DRAFT_776345 [Mycena floridula]
MTALPRGRACVYCRRRKIKCGGERPKCAQCLTANRPDDCEYRDAHGLSNIGFLEDNIARLELRLKELESPVQADSIVLLQNPYSSHDGWWKSPEPPLDIVAMMLDKFLPCASNFGFFLNTTRFRASVLLSTGDISRPSNALLSCVYLFGLRMTTSSNTIQHEPELLSRALELTSQGLSTSHPHKVLHTIQAEVLLSHYYLLSGKFLEAGYHSSAAMSLAVAAQLDRLRYDNPRSRYGDIVEGERINAWWTIWTLEHCWGAALASRASISLSSDAVGQICTPWPMEDADYEQGRLESLNRHGLTVAKFLNGNIDPSVGNSSRAFYAKASLLWERAMSLSSSWRHGISSEDLIVFAAEFYKIENLFQELSCRFPTIDMLRAAPPDIRSRFLVAHSVAHASSMTLHSIFAHQDPESAQKSLSAARSIFQLLNAKDPESQYIDPIMGVSSSLVESTFADL